MSDSSPSSCPKCQAALPAHATEGLCPRCLMAQVMQPSQVSAPEGTPRPTGAAAPELPLPEELTALLPAETYRVDYLIGRGGMGAVYKGEQLRLDRPVAIKLMRRDQGRDHGFEQRFHREALAMAKLNHPNIVSVIDYGEAGPDYLYIVMELVEGADMMEVLRTGRMTQEMALRLLPQICDALQFAHDHGIVHRDIKPSNIMLTRDGRIKMCDFGLAKRHDVESTFQTRSGTGMGTPDYAAPEQFSAADQVDHRADIYALGVMIYQMLTGHLPRGAWKPPTQHTMCDPFWDEIVSHAMQTDPKDRYQAASEVKSDVSSIPLASADQLGPRPSTESEGQHMPTRAASHTPLILGIVLCVVVLAGIPFFTSRPDAGDNAPEASRSAPEAEVHTFAGHRYQFVPGADRWEEAKAKAETMGGHLATITSKEENEFIYATFGDKLDPAIRASSIWIGGFAGSMGQSFKWVTGEPFGFTDWSAGEPDYSGTSGQPMPGTFGVLIKHMGRSIGLMTP
ncbi:MAG: protein kinase [Verrucomicrobiaceae bacterium]|nr:protein kinase [Verrucomicrobiaceae bacterium]